jgi:hypothetical protein
MRENIAQSNTGEMGWGGIDGISIRCDSQPAVCHVTGSINRARREAPMVRVTFDLSLSDILKLSSAIHRSKTSGAWEYVAISGGDASCNDYAGTPACLLRVPVKETN